MFKMSSRFGYAARDITGYRLKKSPKRVLPQYQDVPCLSPHSPGRYQATSQHLRLPVCLTYCGICMNIDAQSRCYKIFIYAFPINGVVYPPNTILTIHVGIHSLSIFSSLFLSSIPFSSLVFSIKFCNRNYLLDHRTRDSPIEKQIECVPLFPLSSSPYPSPPFYSSSSSSISPSPHHNPPPPPRLQTIPLSPPPPPPSLL